MKASIASIEKVQDDLKRLFDKAGFTGEPLDHDEVRNLIRSALNEIHEILAFVKSFPILYLIKKDNKIE